MRFRLIQDGQPVAWAVILCLLGAYLIALGALILWSLT